MTQGIAFIDGTYVRADEARISIFDAGFTRGDAVYDPTSVWKGWVFRLDDHVARFRRSRAAMRLAAPDPSVHRRVLAECVHGAGLAHVRMIVTRGRFPDAAERDPRRCENRFIAYAIPYVWIFGPEKQLRRLHLWIAETRGCRPRPSTRG